ncbi:hypothetical protein ACIBIZ_06085 [Nonomuraea spiralis]|uniref:hypothetical protein n=1 Tax=Nonomuraea spiralis TaxID=46182 RepID=UPI00378C8109
MHPILKFVAAPVATTALLLGAASAAGATPVPDPDPEDVTPSQCVAGGGQVRNAPLSGDFCWGGTWHGELINPNPSANI